MSDGDNRANWMNYAAAMMHQLCMQRGVDSAAMQRWEDDGARSRERE